MDPHALMQGVPEDHAWSSLSRDARAAHALTLMERVLTAVEAENREPDAWEADHLAFALQFMQHDLFSAAMNSIKLAITPATQRSASNPVPHVNVGLSSLRGSLDRLYSKLDAPLWS